MISSLAASARGGGKEALSAEVSSKGSPFAGGVYFALRASTRSSVALLYCAFVFLRSIIFSLVDTAGKIKGKEKRNKSENIAEARMGKEELNINDK